MEVPVPERWEVCGRLERLAYERAMRDRERLPALGYTFDEEAADHAEKFVSLLRHTKGKWAGHPWQWIPWQRWALREIFGWIRADGTRRFRWAYIEIPRKNGKSEFAAAGGLYLMIADGEGGAEVYSAATKKDQARIVFNAAQEMIRQTPELRGRVNSYRAELKYAPTNSFMVPLGADADTLDGLNPHGVVVDELHAHRDRRVLDVLQTATGARQQPLGWIIGTAGVYDPQSIGWVMHQQSMSILDGELEDESMFCFIAAADEEADYREEDSWIQANPSHGFTIQSGYLEEQAKKAEAQPSFRATFERYHMDRWTQVAETWLDMEKWRAAPKRDPEPVLLGRTAYGGLDLSTKIDITAFVMALPDPEDPDFVDLIARFWIPEETVQRRSREDRVPYDAWVRDGWVTATPGDVVDYAFIRHEIMSLASQYNIVEIAYDDWNAEQSALELSQEGITMVPTRQGFRSYTEPAKEMERLVVSGKLRHGHHPVLDWMASRCAISEDPSGNIKPDKKKSRDRIDGIVASAMALGRLILRPRVTPSDGTLITWLD